MSASEALAVLGGERIYYIHYKDGREVQVRGTMYRALKNNQNDWSMIEVVTGDPATNYRPVCTLNAKEIEYVYEAGYVTNSPGRGETGDG